MTDQTEQQLENELIARLTANVWHTTGSGKTLTSFKASELLANEESVKKVI